MGMMSVGSGGGWRRSGGDVTGWFSGRFELAEMKM
jgi:hypothetical protein